MQFLLRALGLVLGLVVVGIVALGVWAWAPDLPRDTLVERYTNAGSQFVTLESGVEVHLRDEGCATCDAVFLIHGSNASLHTWERWTVQLGQRWRIVSIDMPGHGLTGATSDGDYTIERAAGVIEEVRAHLGIDRLHLAGNSRGGAISLRYAVDHPDRLISLALLNSAGAPWPQSDEDEDQPFVYTLLADPGVATALKNFLPRPLVEEALRDAFSDQGAVTQDMIDRYYELIRFPGNRDATILRSQMAYDLEPYERAGELEMPVLIMWGDEDNLVPLDLADRFQEAMPHAQRIVYPGIGHTPMEENPEQSATDFELFLQSAASASAPAAETDATPTHETGQARFGYYLPMEEIRVGDLVLSHVFIDDAASTDAWSGPADDAAFAPVMLQFDDTASDWIENEIGGGYARTVRVLPQRFAITADRVIFAGESDVFGSVMLDARYDRQAVIDAEPEGVANAVVLDGRLQLGEQIIEPAQFMWFAGD